jgi:hypothetical protein
MRRHFLGLFPEASEKLMGLLLMVTKEPTKIMRKQLHLLFSI